VQLILVRPILVQLILVRPILVRPILGQQILVRPICARARQIPPRRRLPVRCRLAWT
jgi:hypothetical protein